MRKIDFISRPSDDTLPTAGLYPYQWNWDSVFVALRFSERDRGWTERKASFKAKRPMAWPLVELFRLTIQARSGAPDLSLRP